MSLMSVYLQWERVFLLRSIFGVFEVHSRNPATSPIKIKKNIKSMSSPLFASPFLYR